MCIIYYNLYIYTVGYEKINEGKRREEMEGSRTYNIAPGLCNTELPAGLKFYWNERENIKTSVIWDCVLLHMMLSHKFKPWWCWEAAYEVGRQSDKVCLGWCKNSPSHPRAWEEWTFSGNERVNRERKEYDILPLAFWCFFTRGQWCGSMSTV